MSRCQNVRARFVLICLATVTAALSGCSPQTQAQSPRPVRQPTAPGPAQRRPGLTTGQKVLLVAGAAALYYLYKKHQNAKGNGPNGRYFRSKNGRVYYRDMKTGAYHWVDPPQQPIQVPAEEWQRYTGQPAPGAGTVIRQAPPGWQMQPAR